MKLETITLKLHAFFASLKFVFKCETSKDQLKKILEPSLQIDVEALERLRLSSPNPLLSQSLGSPLRSQQTVSAPVKKQLPPVIIRRKDGTLRSPSRLHSLSEEMSGLDNIYGGVSASDA
jgi:hypothetical protein